MKKTIIIICFAIALFWGMGEAFACEQPDCPHGHGDKEKGIKIENNIDTKVINKVSVDVDNKNTAIGIGGEGGKAISISKGGEGGSATIKDIEIKTGDVTVKTGDTKTGDVSVKTGDMINITPWQFPMVLPTYAPEIHVLPGQIFDFTSQMPRFAHVGLKPLYDDVETVDSVTFECKKTLGLKRFLWIFPKRRIKIEDVVPFTLEKYRETIQKKGWDPKNMRLRVWAKESPDRFSSGGDFTGLISTAKGNIGSGATAGVVPGYAQNTANYAHVVEFHLVQPKPIPILPPVEKPKSLAPKAETPPPPPSLPPAPVLVPAPAPASARVPKEPEIGKFKQTFFKLNFATVENFVSSRVEFKNIETLHETAERMKRELVPLFQKHPDLRVLLVGFTSPEGPSGNFKTKTNEGIQFSNNTVYNRGGLGAARANKVLEKIINVVGKEWETRFIAISAGWNENNKFPFNLEKVKGKLSPKEMEELEKTLQRRVDIVPTFSVPMIEN